MQEKSTTLPAPAKDGEENTEGLLEELREQYLSKYGVLKAKAYKIVGTVEGSDDVVQEAFANTANAIIEGTDIKNLGGWLSKCVYNSSIQLVKRRSSQSQPLVENLDLVDPNAYLDQVFARRRHSRDVYLALRQLTPVQRSAFVMSEMHGLKQKEIAEIMNCSKNAVAQLVMRARKQIRYSVGPKSFALLPVFLLFCRKDNFKARCIVEADAIRAKVTHMQTTTSALLQRTVEMVGQSAAAIVAGTVVLAVAALPVGAEKQTSVNGGAESPSVSDSAPHLLNGSSRAGKSKSRPDERKSDSSSQTAKSADEAVRPEIASRTGHGEARHERLKVRFQSDQSKDRSGASPTGSSGGSTDGAVSVAALRKVTYTTDVEGNYEVFSIISDGSEKSNMTFNTAADIEPSWSGNGRTLVFTSLRDGDTEIYLMNADGSGQTRLTNNSSTDSEPGASADGSKIAFRSGRAGNNEIYSMNADGSGQTRLSDNPGADGAPAWSPDGLKITFQSDRDDPWDDIYVMNADGSGVTNLTNTPGKSEVDPDWSPDGLKIVFETQRDGNDEIYVMNADGSGQTRLTDDPGSDESPEWSPDGSQIVFKSDRDGNDEIYLMNADGSGQTNISRSPGSREHTPTW